MARKSLFVTYFLWLCGGFFGLHHFYLGRDFQALIWWMFAGGYFGFGLIRDIWRIPEYVQEANLDASYIEKLTEKMRKHPKPPFSTVRYFGQLTVSDALGNLVVSAVPHEYVPEEYRSLIAAAFVPLAVGIGVYLVGNIGRAEGKFSGAVFGAYLSVPAYFILDVPICLTSFAACSYFNSYCSQWRRVTRTPKSLSRRVLFLSFCGLLYLSLWGSWLYFNCTLPTQDKETIKCKEAAKHFFKSPIWNQFVTVMKELWRCLREHGWREVWRQTIEALDPTGEANALKVLGLNSTATQQEITLQYRRLSRTWHPDKHQDIEEKQKAQDKFIEIQQAYEILSKIKSQRIAQNVRNSEESSSTE